MRPSKRDYYLNIALAVAQRGTCLRRNYGAVIVKDDEIVGTGYTGSPRGEVNCLEFPDSCTRDILKVPSGERYELCRSVHAEANAIISAGRSRCIGATLYLAGFNTKTGERIEARPCTMCRNLIVNVGMEKVIT